MSLFVIPCQYAILFTWDPDPPLLNLLLSVLYTPFTEGFYVHAIQLVFLPLFSGDGIHGIENLYISILGHITRHFIALYTNSSRLSHGAAAHVEKMPTGLCDGDLQHTANLLTLQRPLGTTTPPLHLRRAQRNYIIPHIFGHKLFFLLAPTPSSSIVSHNFKHTQPLSHQLRLEYLPGIDTAFHTSPFCQHLPT